MKISNSKKQLAKIINENGGWREGAAFAAQDSQKDDFPCRVCFYRNRPVLRGGDTRWLDSKCYGIIGDGIHLKVQLPNWHQTILSRDEYFYLYPAPVKVVVENNTACRLTVTDGSSIEQLAADYRNAKDYADRKQQEADAAKAEAEAKLAAYVAAAGSAVGLVLSVRVPESEPELVITDWRDLQLGDVIEYVDGDIKDKIGMTGPVVELAKDDSDGMPVRLKCDNGPDNGRFGWPRKWRFVRRPAKGDANA